jgi:hypothetical protein
MTQHAVARRTPKIPMPNKRFVFFCKEKMAHDGLMLGARAGRSTQPPLPTLTEEEMLLPSR